MGYRVSTAIFALLFAAMVVKDLTRPDPEVVPREPWQTPSAVPVAPGVPGEDDEASAPGIRPDAPGRELPFTPDEPTLDLAIRLLAGEGSRWNRSRAVELLRSRRDEVVPILEDWLHRREELWRSELRLKAVPWVYAELAGARALPLLDDLLTDPPGRWDNYHLEALTRVDDPDAVAALRRYHEELSAHAVPVKADYLWHGAPGFRELLKAWARVPPPKVPDLRGGCRWTWFQYGTMGDRAEIWPILDEGERLQVLGGTGAYRWGAPWSERFVEAAEAGLVADDANRRVQAVFHVVGAAAYVSEVMLTEAERVLTVEIRAAEGRPSDVKPTRASLRDLRGRFEKTRRGLEAERRKRELLTPRDVR